MRFNKPTSSLGSFACVCEPGCQETSSCCPGCQQLSFTTRGDRRRRQARAPFPTTTNDAVSWHFWTNYTFSNGWSKGVTGYLRIHQPTQSLLAKAIWIQESLWRRKYFFLDDLCSRKITRVILEMYYSEWLPCQWRPRQPRLSRFLTLDPTTSKLLFDPSAQRVSIGLSRFGD